MRPCLHEESYVFQEWKVMPFQSFLLQRAYNSFAPPFAPKNRPVISADYVQSFDNTLDFSAEFRNEL